MAPDALPDQSATPRVVRRKRGVALEPETVYVGRPTVYGNPFVIGKDGDRARCVELYGQWLREQPDLLERARRELRGKDLACWCAPEACHADVLLEIANSDEQPVCEPAVLAHVRHAMAALEADLPGEAWLALKAAIGVLSPERAR